MIYIEDLFKILKKNQINFFTGVPDSVLKNFLSKLETLSSKNHVESFNEGSAISIGIGHYLATKKIPCVYLQNSGLGNAINPIISIAHPKVYSIPLLLLIGWRGSPQAKFDEPQHSEKGKITREILKLLGIKFIIIRSKKNLNKIRGLINFAKKNSKPVAILVEKNILFEKNKKKKIQNLLRNGIKREILITELLKNIKKGTKIISTTGYTSRELNQISKRDNLKTGEDFYMVGGMGHSLMVSLGHSLNKKNSVICLDGDGSIFMHLGSFRTTGIFGKNNIKHIIFNNFCHESVGGQRTFSENVNFGKIAKNLGYCV